MSERLRIVHVGAGMIPIPPPGYGAVEKHIWNLTQALDARGHSVRIVNKVFGETSKDEYRFALWARREVAREPYDVLHLHTPGVATIFQAMGPRRFVYTTHSRHWAGAEGVGERIGFWLEKRAVAAAQEVIAVSRFVGQQIGRPSHVIPNGVDVERYAPIPQARQGRLVVGLGEVAEHKQWHVAAAAVRDLDAQLVIIGPIRDVGYAKRVEEMGAGKVTLLGAVDETELVRRLGEADVMAHPSLSESFGMAVVEGMSAGLPVIVSDLLSFLVTHGQEGYLIPSKDEAERVRRLRERLAALLADPALRARMGAAARETALRAYSWPSVAERVEAVYQAAARGGDAP